MSDKPFLYSAIDNFSGEFLTSYRCSVASIPNYFSEIFFGFDYFDNPNSMTSMKNVMKMRQKEIVEISRARADLKEVAQTDEAPLSADKDVHKARSQDNYFTLLVIGSSLIIFDMYKSILV